MNRYIKKYAVCGFAVCSIVLGAAGKSVLAEEASIKTANREMTASAEEDYSKIAVEGLPDTFKNESGFYSVSFKVRNLTSQSIHSISINMSFLDENGDIIAHSYPQVPDVVQPGQAVNIEGTADASNEIKYVSVTGVSYDGADKQQYEVIFDSEIETITLGEPSITDKPETRSTDMLHTTAASAKEAFYSAIAIKRSDIDYEGQEYFYRRMPLLKEEVEAIDEAKYLDENACLKQGAVYRSLAKELEGFYYGGAENYNSWRPIVPMIFGFTAPQTWEEMVPYVNDASIYITRYNSLPEIMNRFQQLDCVEGNFDYEARNFEFVINDLDSAARDLNISGEMLGYILASLEEYGPSSSFKGNTFSFTLSYAGSTEKRSELLYEDFECKENGEEVNQLDILHSLYEGTDCVFQYQTNMPDSGLYIQGAFYTHRKVQFGSSYNAVVYAYGTGEKGYTCKENDYLYRHFTNDEQKYLDLYKQTAISYMTYNYAEGNAHLTFLFDENNRVSWVTCVYMPEGGDLY